MTTIESYVILAVAAYLLAFGVVCDTKNLRSMVLFKLVPVACALALSLITLGVI